MIKDNMLYFDKPANEWIEGLPLGNGKLGAMIMGYAAQEQVCLNHENIWHKIVDRQTTPVSHHLPHIRQLLLQRKWEEGARLLETNLQPTGPDLQVAVEEYQPACDLVIQVPCPYPVEKYARMLDLEDGVAKVVYCMGTVRYERIYFISTVHNLMVVKIKGNHQGAVAATLWFERELTSECHFSIELENNLLMLQASIENGTSFVVAGKLLSKGGSVSTAQEDKKLSIRGADEALLLVAIATDKESKHPRELCHQKLSLSPENINKLLKRHIENHKSLFSRVSFHLGGANKVEREVTTDRIVHSAYIGDPKDNLFELMFQMGRYLLIASSRPGSKAANLQGIWNHEMHPDWQSDWHLDTNVQMNYWLAEVGNLSECSLPLFELVKSLIPDGEDAALKLYGCKGVFFPIAFAGKGTPLPGSWVAWTGAAGWLAQHFWWHYEYTLDREFLLNTAYPYMEKVAMFYQDFLIKDTSGKYVIVPSLSPENKPLGRKTMVCINATMDIAIIGELLGNLVTASHILGQDVEQRKAWQEILNNLPDWPFDKHGMLKEWADETALDNPCHRHFSHLYPLFPGDMFSREETPELMDAAAKAVRARETAGYPSMNGWSYPYLALLHARLREGDEALQCLRYLAKSCMVSNLLTTLQDWRFQGLSSNWKTHPPRLFQIEAILGASAAIAEMLLQSHNGLVRILPALPLSWNEGEIKGLRARGGFEIDIRWKAGVIQHVLIHSLLGQPCCIRLCRKHGEICVICNGESVETEYLRENQIRFRTKRGKSYRLLKSEK